MDLYTIFSEINSVKNVLGDFISSKQALWIALFFAVGYIKNVIRNEKIITRIEDDAIALEKNELRDKIKIKLTSMKSRLYLAMEEFVYNEQAPIFVNIIRKYREVPVPSSDYLRDFRDAIDKTLFKIILPQLENDIELYSLAVVDPCEETRNTITRDLRDNLINETFKLAGRNNDIQCLVEKTITYEDVCNGFDEIIKNAQYIRGKRDKSIKKQTSEYR